MKYGNIETSSRQFSAMLLLFIGLMITFPFDVDAAEKMAAPRGDLLLIVGSPGTAEFGAEFRRWGKQWIKAAEAGQIRVTSLGMQADDATLVKLREVVAGFTNESSRPLWIVLLGHGTYDGRVAKFNLPETDLEPAELQSLLKPLQRPIALINCASASAPFLEELASPGRVVITSTSSGNEVNFAHFGQYLAESIQHLDADLDKDLQVSLLEAFLRASRLTEEFYSGDGRLATEHANLDDNGDARAVPGSGFAGIRPTPRKDTGGLLPDGLVAQQWVLVPNADDARLSVDEIIRRNELEYEISVLRDQKEEMPADDYYSALEPLFIELAKLLK